MRTRSDSALGELPQSLQRFLVFEQQNLWNPERLRVSPAGAAGLDARYLPESRAVFRLPCYWVKRKHLYVYGEEREAHGELAMLDGEGPEARVLLPVHPAELRHYASFLDDVRAVDAKAEGLRLVATPTSSTRTLLVWPHGHPEQAFFAKMSLRSTMLGDRRLQRRKVAGSVGLSRLVQESESLLPSELKFFPEKLGVVPRRMSDSGVIFRAIPQEIKQGKVVSAALFSLMGSNGRQLPLLRELMKMKGFKVHEFLEAVVLGKFARIWVELAFGCGLLLEAHGQDLLLALLPDLVPLGGMYYRDFEGLTVDWELRRARGFSTPSLLPHSCEWYGTYGTWGYPLYQLASWKMLTSLFDYLHLFLGELESAILEWQQKGVMTGEKIRRGELTFLFSRYLRGEIRERFGMRESDEYDIQQHLNRFVKFLMLVRREILADSVHLQ